LREQEKQKLTVRDSTSRKTVFASVEKSGMRRPRDLSSRWRRKKSDLKEKTNDMEENI